MRRARVLRDVGQRLGDREVRGGLDGRREAAGRHLAQLHGDRGPAGEALDRRGQAALGQHRRVDPPRQLAQLARRGCQLVREPVQERCDRRGVGLHPRAHHAHVERQGDEPLLRAVVQVALDLAARGVRRGHDPHARLAQLLGARRLDLAPAQRLLGRPALGDVEDRAVHPQPPAGARDELAAVEHPAHRAVGAQDAVLQDERVLVVGDRRHGPQDALPVVLVDDADQRAPGAGDEVVGGIAGDALDLVGDQLEPVAGVPRRAVDGARDGRHQGAQQRVVGPLLDGAQARTGAGEELRARERAVQVVVGAHVEPAVGRPGARRPGDREQPGGAEPRIVAQRHADLRRLRARRVAVDDHQIRRLVPERRERAVGAVDRARGVPRRVQPGGDLRFGGADDQDPGASPPDGAVHRREPYRRPALKSRARPAESSWSADARRRRCPAPPCRPPPGGPRRARRGPPPLLGGPGGIARRRDRLPRARAHARGRRPAGPRARGPGRGHAAPRRAARRRRAGRGGRASSRATTPSPASRSPRCRRISASSPAPTGTPWRRPSRRSTAPTRPATSPSACSPAAPPASCSGTSACASGPSGSRSCSSSASSPATAGRWRSRTTTSAACTSATASSRPPSTSSSWAWRSPPSWRRATGSPSACCTPRAPTCA